MTDTQINTAVALLRARDAEIAALKALLAERDITIRHLRSLLAQQDQELAARESAINDLFLDLPESD